MSQRKQIRVFEVWDTDRVYQGRVQVMGGGEPELYDFPYCEEVEPPKCPDQPREAYHDNYSDGWYYLKLGNGDTAIRQKKASHVCNEKGQQIGVWSSYKVIASLGDVKFVNKGLLG